MEKVKISKSYNLENESFIINYEGITEINNNDLSDVNNLLTDFVNNHIRVDMVTNVRILATIFKNFNNMKLEVFSHYNGVSENIRYKNDELLYYEKVIISKGCKFEYNNLNGIKFECDKQGSKVVISLLTEMVEQLYFLKQFKKYDLNTDDKILIEIYRLFYNENPDFSDKNINIKIQTMMSILVQFNISLSEYSFTLWKNSKIPTSEDLNMQINKLYSFGKIKNEDNYIVLSEEAKMVIKTVSKSLNELINNNENFLEKLMLISRIIYISRYRISLDTDIQEIAKITEVSQEDVLLCRSLVKKVENKSIK